MPVWELILVVALMSLYVTALVLWMRAVIVNDSLISWAKVVWCVSILAWTLIALLVWYFLGPTPFGIGKKIAAT